MLLVTKLLEDARGGRSVSTQLYLHEDASTSWQTRAPGRLVGESSSLADTSAPIVAELQVGAPDDLDEERIATRLAEARQHLESPGSERVDRDDFVAILSFLDAGSQPARKALVSQLFAAAEARLARRDTWLPLRVLRIELREFRGVNKLLLAFSVIEQTTVFIGVNGSCKTTILDATALLLSHLEARIRKLPRRARAFTDDDIMNGSDTTELSITTQIGTNPVTWALSHLRSSEPAHTEERGRLFSLDEEVAHIQGDLDRGNICLPVIVYYPVNRAVLDIPLRIRTQHPFEPLDAYEGAIAAGRSNFRLFFEWFRNREDLENETRIHESAHRDHQLEAVRRAIHLLVPEFSDLRVQRSPLRMAVKKGSRTLYVNQLSDGEKCMLALTGDLARRLAMANPLADDPLRGGGVVLIDEIELHLHPSWQRRIVPALERTFPNCQFIVTTHSPAILGHVDHESVFILKPEAGGLRAAHPDVSKGMDVSRIYEDLLDTPARPEEFEAKLKELYKHIDEGDTKRARAVYDELAETLHATDPALVKAEVLLRRREGARR